MKGTCALIVLAALFSSSSQAAEVTTCSELSGRWEITTGSHIAMVISPSLEACGAECVVLNVQYNLNDARRNRLYCHEGVEGIKGQGPMVIAFEGVYGGHSIGTYNRKLKLLWGGVVPKSSKGEWEAKMDSYWFKRVD